MPSSWTDLKGEWTAHACWGLTHVETNGLLGERDRGWYVFDIFVKPFPQCIAWWMRQSGEKDLYVSTLVSWLQWEFHSPSYSWRSRLSATKAAARTHQEGCELSIWWYIRFSKKHHRDIKHLICFAKSPMPQLQLLFLFLFLLALKAQWSCFTCHSGECNLGVK